MSEAADEAGTGKSEAVDEASIVIVSEGLEGEARARRDCGDVVRAIRRGGSVLAWQLYWSVSRSSIGLFSPPWEAHVFYSPGGGPWE